MADELLGDARVSILRFFNAGTHVEIVPLKYNGLPNVAGIIKLEFSYVTINDF